jgi:glycosyltransferase involved in cell wall biosynthesis
MEKFIYISSQTLERADNGISIPGIQRVDFLKREGVSLKILDIGENRCNIILAIFKYFFFPRECCRSSITRSIIQITRTINKKCINNLILDTDYMVICAIYFSIVYGDKVRISFIPNDYPALVVASQIKYGQYDNYIQWALLKFEYIKTKFLWKIASSMKIKFAFVNRADIRFMKSHSTRNSDATYYLVPNGTNNLPNLHEHQPFDDEYDVHLLHVGSIERGQKRYLENFIDNIFLKSDQTKFALHCVGFSVDKNFRAKYKKYKNINIYENVSDLKAIYMKCDVVINPAKKLAGQFNKTMEAMAHGKVVIGYKMSFYALSGTISQKNCIKVRTDSEFLETIDKFDLKQAKQIGKEAQKLMRNDYDWKTTLVTFKHFYTCKD